MENTLENILLAFASKTLNMENLKVAELLKTDDGESIKDGALQSLLDLDVARVTKLKESVNPDGGDKFDNGYKKAQGEILTKFEGDIISHYGLDTQLKGLDLVQHVIKTKSKAADEKVITPDEIKLTPTYLDAIKNITNTKDVEIEKINNDNQKVLNNFKREQNMVKVFDKANSVIDTTLKPIFSQDSARALNQRKQIHAIIAKHDYKVGDDGRITPLTADGNLLEDEHSNPVDFNTIVKTATTTLLDLPTAEQRSDGGDPGDGGGKPADGGDIAFSWNGQKPANDKEYLQLIKDAKSTKEKGAIRDSYRG